MTKWKTSIIWLNVVCLAIDLWCVYFGASHDAPAFAVWMAASGAIAASYLGAELQTAMSAIEDDHTLLSQ
jgi:hypothetical protein